MVELSFPFPEERAGFDEFYSNHISMLLTIDGLDTAQRFETTHEAIAPFMAIYSLANDHVLQSEGYTSRAGPSSVSEDYRPKMLNWKRNVVTGPAFVIDVPMSGWLMLIDRVTEHSAPLPEGFTPFRPTELDMTFAERGILLGHSGQPPIVDNQSDWVIRRMSPLHARRES